MSGPDSGRPADDEDRRDDTPHESSNSNAPATDHSSRRQQHGDGSTGDEPNESHRSSTGDDASHRGSSGSGIARGPNRNRSRDRPSDETVTIEDDGLIRWFLKTDDETVVAIRDVLSGVGVVVLIGLVIFGLSGVWPPLVAVESGSMEPNMAKGDLIFTVDESRYVGDDPTGDTGVVTYTDGADAGYEKFGQPGDVIIFEPGGNERSTPIIHRAHFWVDAGENWVETKANPEYLDGATCDQISTCPAEHAGFVTKGDNNDGYDQQSRVSGADTDVVKPEWITGKGQFRIPWLGHLRLAIDEFFGTATPGPVGSVIEPAAATAGLESSLPERQSASMPATTALAGLTAGSIAVVSRWRRRR